MVAVARKHQNVYIDTAAYTSARLPAELVAFMRTKTRQRQGPVRHQLSDDRARPRWAPSSRPVRWSPLRRWDRPGRAGRLALAVKDRMPAPVMRAAMKVLAQSNRKR